MQATIDSAGRLVIPRALREQLGLRPGLVEVTADGGAVRIEPVAGHALEERDGLLVIPATGEAIDDDLVLGLLDASRR